MKKLLIVLAVLLSFQTDVKASHVLGGEIRWECLPNGRFVFYARVFRDCTGIPYNFDNGTLDIVGNPLPRSATNSPINSILLKPDSTRWIQSGFGDTSPKCKPGGDVITCGDGDEGAVQQFFYQSDPIQLRGTPPSAGWRLYFQQPCCRPLVTNLASAGNMMLRAIMYSDRSRTPTDQCYDSSPQFLALPTNMLCRGYEFTYNHTAIDKDLDSLIYSWDRTYNTPPAAPNPVPFAPGYSASSPTPDKSFNTQNIPAEMDPLTGQVKMGVWSGSPLTLDYLTVVRVDAYREGRVIASVFREIPFVFFDCARLPSGQINRPPEIFINGDSAEGVIKDIVAGQEVQIPFQATDLDFAGGIPGLQRVTVEPEGFMFSDAPNMNDPNDCVVDFIKPCAILRNQNPIFNNLAEPPRSQISGFAGVATEFIWDTRCHHIGFDKKTTGVPGQNIGIYNFVMRTYDDHCPIPGINYPTITVRIRDPIPLEQPIVKGVSINLDGSITYQWAPPLDSSNQWVRPRPGLGDVPSRYRVQINQPNDGFPPSETGYITVDTNERRYMQERRSGHINVYQPDPNDITKPDILKPIPNKDYYLRMRAMSGCKRNAPSIWSQPARVIEITSLQPSGEFPQEPLRAEATLRWNRAKNPNAPTHAHYEYESPTTYYIWTNDQFTVNGDADYPGLADQSNWVLRGSTTNLTYEVPASTCSGPVAFRVEARDTIVTVRQNSRPEQRDSVISLSYSAFSVIDTLFMVAPGFIPAPKLDTLEVKPNGNVFMRVDAGGAGTIGRWRIYRDAVDPANLIDSIVKPADSILLTSLNASLSDIDLIIEAVDECNDGRRTASGVYNTHRTSGVLPADSCSDQFNLSWTRPGGFPNGVRGYRIYRQLKADTMIEFTDWELVQTITNANTLNASMTVRSKTQYRFKVVAYDSENAVNIAAEQGVSISDKRTYEVVPAPELRCSYVNDDGSVTLNFLPAHPSRDPGIDSTENWTAYRFQYRANGGNWVTFNGSLSVPQNGDSVRITGINAIDNSYEFRATSLSGCSGLEEAPFSTINLIEPTATLIADDPSKRVNISWTGTGVFSNTDEFISKSVGDDMSSIDLFGGGAIGRNNPSVPKTFVDSENDTVCDNIGSYYITKMDQLSGCMNRSRPDTARIIDQIPPPPQKIEAVSYELFTIGTTPSGNPVYLPNFGQIVMNWEEEPSDDIKELMIFAPNLTTGQNDSISTVIWDQNRDTIPRAAYNGGDSTYYFSAQSIDECGRKAEDFSQFDYHMNMDLDIEWDPCDSLMELSWNGYYYFQDSAEVEYTVERLFFRLYNVNPIGIVPCFDSIEVIGTTADTTFDHKIFQDSTTFVYRVVARPSGNSTVYSNSSWDVEQSIFDEVPRYNYFTYATVNPAQTVDMQLYKDTGVTVGGYTIYRGEDTLNMQPVNRIGPNDNLDLVDFEDLTAKTEERAYFYQIIVENQCGNPVDTTNYASTIHLTVEPRNEALTNVLRWNEYQGWDSAVSFYNIYRGVNGNTAKTLYATVPAGDASSLMMYVDDVYDNSYSQGEYCYKIEAVQGNVNPEFAAVVEPATSTSNEVCVIQKPLFYVPNAFAPDGINRVFGPEGQFFDFTRYEMIIYNRWGELIFETRDINEGWDGTVDGEIAPLGSYVYTIRFVDAEGEEHRRKGTVTLIK